MTFRYMKLYACKKGELGALRTVSTPEQLAAVERQQCFIDHFIRTENLEPDLLEALRQTGIEVPPAAAASMAARPRTNTSSRRRDPAYYYDATTEKLVGDRERLIVEKFGYRAPSERADLRGLEQERGSGSFSRPRK
ncbi:hypothetical protein ACFWZU_00015 [Frateuria sp. GZRR33]|uniref:hypothetical protein n=1 Tax=Frateuria sp. GZRR33 TaxID=3351535 RepID=UPI003EDCA0AB